MQILLLIALALTTVIVVGQYRQRRDRDELSAWVGERGGQVAHQVPPERGFGSGGAALRLGLS